MGERLMSDTVPGADDARLVDLVAALVPGRTLTGTPGPGRPRLPVAWAGAAARPHATTALAHLGLDPARTVQVSQHVVLQRSPAAGERVSAVVRPPAPARTTRLGTAATVVTDLTGADDDALAQVTTRALQQAGGRPQQPPSRAASAGSRSPATHLGSCTLTRQVLAEHAELTGDHNPVHHDAAAARAAGLPGVVAHGSLLLAVAEALVAQPLADLHASFVHPVVVPVGPAGAVVDVEMGDPVDDLSDRPDVRVLRVRHEGRTAVEARVVLRG